MSEFYASSSFLDRNQFSTKYNSLISVINSQANSIDRIANKLKKYSGFGIECQINYIKNYSARLMDYKEDIRTEYNSIIKIIDIINDSEKKAVGILGGISDEYKLDGYDVLGNTQKNETGSFSEMYRKVFDVFTELGKNISNIFDNLDKLDVFKETPEVIKKVFSDILGPTFEGLDAIGKVMEIADFYADGVISFSDIAGTLSNSTSITESVLKITEVIGNFKLMPDYKVAITDTLKIGGKYIGSFTQYIPVASVFLSTVFSGAKTYDKVSADGTVDAKDWAEIGIDASIDGLIVCGEAVVSLAFPPAAIGFAAFEIANVIAENVGGKSIKDMIKDEVKEKATFIGNMLGKLMGRAVPA